MDIGKIKAFVAIFASKASALLNFLDSTLDKMEANPKLMAWMTEHYPNVVKYEKEAHAAIDMVMALEGVTAAQAGELVETLHAMESVGS